MTSTQHLQIVFSESGAGGLKHARRLSSQSDWVVVNPNLVCPAIGPINLLLEPQARVRWIHENTPELFAILDAMFDTEPPEKAMARQSKAFLDTVRAWREPATIWYSSADIDDLSCLIGMCSIWPTLDKVSWIDVSKLAIPAQRSMSVGSLAPEALLDAQGLAVPIKGTDVERLADQRHRLMRSAKGLRIFDGNRIEEVALNHLDEHILRQINEDWTEVRKVFAAVLDDGWSRGVRDRDYFFLLSRLHHLTETGRIERRGESESPLFSDDPLKGVVRRIQ